MQKRQFRIKEIIDFDEKKDLALLMVEGIHIRPLPLGDVTKPAIGDEIYVAGNPEGFEGTFSQGIISGFRGSRFIQITAPISHGSSGGPVLNKKGEVIGIAVGLVEEGQHLNFAISASELLVFKKDAMRIYKEGQFVFSGINSLPIDTPNESQVSPERKSEKVLTRDVIAMSDDSIFLMNIKKIRTDEGTIKAWVKTVRLKDKDKLPGASITLSEYESSPHVLTLIEFDCKKELMRTGFIIDYAENGKPNVSGSPKDEWKNVPPDTIAHSWLEAACKN